MFRNFRTALATGILGAAALLAPTAANATLMISVDYNSGSSTSSCTDNDILCDLDATVGSIIYAASDATEGWSSQINIGYSQPVIGDPTLAAIDLTVTAISTSAGTVSITLVDDAFFSPAGSISAQSTIGGTYSDQVDFTTALNGSTLTSATFNPLNGSGGTQNGSGLANSVPYTLSINTLLTADSLAGNCGNGKTSCGSIDTTLRVTAVPEPGTLAILGVGLAGLGLMRRRRRVAA